jgi:hypothetical protein
VVVPSKERPTCGLDTELGVVVVYEAGDVDMEISDEVLKSKELVPGRVLTTSCTVKVRLSPGFMEFTSILFWVFFMVTLA